MTRDISIGHPCIGGPLNGMTLASERNVYEVPEQLARPVVKSTGAIVYSGADVHVHRYHLKAHPKSPTGFAWVGDSHD